MSPTDKQLLPAVSIHGHGMAGLNDETLMCALVAGQGEAFSVLYDRYYPTLFWMARRIVGNDQEAEDVVQQVFLETFKSRTAFDPGKGSFRAWISRRTFDRARSHYSYLATHKHYVVEPLDESVQAAPFSPEKIIFAAELIAKLSPRRQEIIRLRFFEGLTREEVVARTGYTHSVVRHEFYRAIEELRTWLDQNSTEKMSRGDESECHKR